MASSSRSRSAERSLVSLAELQRLGVTFRPFGSSTAGTGSNRHAPFRAPWRATLQLLARELANLGAVKIVCELAMQEADFRIDGLPRASARAAHPGVALSFDSIHGPLRYYTDEFRAWEENLRAIALSMEALRKVDRYGVSKRGEQYRGWRQLPQSTDDYGMSRAEDAQAYLDEVWGGNIRDALFATHPDRGGDVNEFHKVQRARELLA